MLQKTYQKYKPYYKENLHLALPIVGSQLGHTLVQIADSVIVGHFTDTEQLAAVSLVNSIFILILVIGLGISYGLTPLIAQESGRLRRKDCGKLLANSLLINLVIGLLLYFSVRLGVFAILDHLDQTASVVLYAKPYLNLLSLSIIPLLIFQTFRQFAEGLGFTKQAMFISVWGNVINIILGVILVRGMFGIKPMGVSGVGVSSLVDRILMASTMCIYVLHSNHFKRYLLGFKFRFVNKLRLLKIIKIGAPVALQYTFEISAFSGAALLIGTIGDVEQAAHQIAISLAAMTYMIASGVASAATIKTGNNFGKRSFLDLRRSAIGSYHIILVFMCFTALAFVIFNRQLPYIISSDVEVVDIAAHLLIIAGFFQLFDGTQVIGLGVLRGLGDVNIPTLITFFAYWVVGIPIGYLLGFHFHLGVNGIWYGLTFGLLTASILLFFRFQNKTKSLSIIDSSRPH
ncbi:MATE family multidrug resistance protein [Pedobacter sp. UYP30]|uniref:MATE family efflux transporter n=1 Tax=Pedobacter sp. UYP30 TaxID=1756400 RepID=UPI0033924FC1